MTLLFLVRYQTVSLIDTKVEPRQGSAEYLELKFIFATPEWSSLRKTLHMSSGDFSEPYILESDIFRVPTYYTQQHSFCITLLGDSGNTLVPTNVLEISLSPSNKLWQATPPDPQNSVYVQLLQQLVDYEDRLSALEQSGGGGGSGVNFKPDETLTLKDGVLSVNTTNNMEKDNTLPITSAGVYATVGNIEALLKTI